jgi:hypothetical protein
VADRLPQRISLPLNPEQALMLNVLYLIGEAIMRRDTPAVTKHHPRHCEDGLLEAGRDHARRAARADGKAHRRGAGRRRLVRTAGPIGSRS